jgi:hypothetical protein
VDAGQAAVALLKAAAVAPRGRRGAGPPCAGTQGRRASEAPPVLAARRACNAHAGSALPAGSRQRRGGGCGSLTWSAALPLLPTAAISLICASFASAWRVSTTNCGQGRLLSRLAAAQRSAGAGLPAPADTPPHRALLLLLPPPPPPPTSTAHLLHKLVVLVRVLHVRPRLAAPLALDDGLLLDLLQLGPDLRAGGKGGAEGGGWV